MIKKLLIMILTISMLVISCASTDKVSESDDKQEDVESSTKKNTVVNMNFKAFNIKDVDSINKHDNNAPDWYNNPGVFYQEYGMDIIVGTGQATGSNPGLTERTATASAQANAAQQITTIINGLGTDETTSISGVRLSGAKVIRKAISEDGKTCYVAVMLDEKRTLETVKKTLENATKDNEAYTDEALDYTIVEVKKRVDTVQESKLKQIKN